MNERNKLAQNRSDVLGALLYSVRPYPKGWKKGAAHFLCLLNLCMHHTHTHTHSMDMCNRHQHHQFIIVWCVCILHILWNIVDILFSIYSPSTGWRYSCFSQFHTLLTHATQSVASDNLDSPRNHRHHTIGLRDVCLVHAWLHCGPNPLTNFHNAACTPHMIYIFIS